MAVSICCFECIAGNVVRFCEACSPSRSRLSLLIGRRCVLPADSHVVGIAEKKFNLHLIIKHVIGSSLYTVISKCCLLPTRPIQANRLAENF